MGRGGRRARVRWQPMQGHLPGPPQPHFPVGLGPFIGYVATREPRPFGDRPPEEPAWRESDDDALDQFADVGEWEPMHRPLIKVMAVDPRRSRSSWPASGPCWSFCSPLVSVVRRRRRTTSQTRPPTTITPPMTAATTIPVSDPPCGEGAVVVVVGAVVEVRRRRGRGRRRRGRGGRRGAPTAPRRPRPGRLTGARSSPAPTPGVGKWLAGVPMLACSGSRTGGRVRGRRGRRSGRWSRPGRRRRWAVLHRPMSATAGGARRRR